MSEIGYTYRPVKYKHSNPNRSIIDAFDYTVGAKMDNIVDLYDIPPEKINLGGLVYVIEDDNFYKLIDKSQIGDSNGWEIFSIDLSGYYTKLEIADLLIDKVDKEDGKGLSDENYTSIEKTKLSGIEEQAQKNVQSDWQENDSQKDSFIKNRPNQTNFNIYNQNKTDKITVATTTKTSIIVATTGNLNLPSYNQNDSFIGRVFGKYTNAASDETITLDFTIGNRTYSTQINHDSDLQNSYVPFYLDYVINFPEDRRASFEGVVVVGNQSYLIDLDPNYLLPNVITGLLFNIEVTLSGGELISNSSYLHRNYN